MKDLIRPVRCSLRAVYLVALIGITNAFADQDESHDTEAPSTHTLLSIMSRAEPSDASIPSDSLDPAVLFNRACSQCHDTERATSRQKSYHEWLMTVQRMADKPGAGIAPNEITPIAEYLSGLNDEEPVVIEEHEVPSITEVLAASDIVLNATVSVLWRDGDQQVENDGFFPDVWVGAEWRPQNNPFSLQVMACTTCHDDGSGGLNAELVEGSFRVDLIHLMTRESAVERESGFELEARAGRFRVPFGAYSGMAHPGVYRTLTHPLMYNMGRRVGYYEPVLPMPYADEGVDVSLGQSMPMGFVFRADGYAVNGLQEGALYQAGVTATIIQMQPWAAASCWAVRG